MADKNKSSSEQKSASGKSIKDLDTRKDDMNKVKGGRAARLSSDPCEGGEIAKK